jgi:hypothetical protein
LEASECGKISRLNSIQEFFLHRQYPACYGNGERILAAKQFGHCVYISISGGGDQFRFWFVVSRVRRTSHIQLCCAALTR